MSHQWNSREILQWKDAEQTDVTQGPAIFTNAFKKLHSKMVRESDPKMEEVRKVQSVVDVNYDFSSQQPVIRHVAVIPRLKRREKSPCGYLNHADPHLPSQHTLIQKHSGGAGNVAFLGSAPVTWKQMEGGQLWETLHLGWMESRREE